MNHYSNGRLISVFQRPLRTNNDLEGWHYRLYAKVRKKNILLLSTFCWNHSLMLVLGHGLALQVLSLGLRLEGRSMTLNAWYDFVLDRSRKRQKFPAILVSAGSGNMSSSREENKQSSPFPSFSDHSLTAAKLAVRLPHPHTSGSVQALCVKLTLIPAMLCHCQPVLGA